jgi:hypothetical protein
MKAVLLSFFFFTLVSAHLPVFKDYNDCVLTDLDIDHQSIGIYLKIPKNTAANCTFAATAAKEIAVSVSIPHGRYLKTDGDNLVVELTGANTSELSCEAGYDGWNSDSAATSFRRLLDLTLNKSAVLRTPKFEPFGVGGYHPIAACNTTAVVSDTVSVVVTNNNDHDVYISIGLGTEEAIAEMIFVHGWTMSFSVTMIWLWAGYPFLAIGLPFLTVLSFAFLIRWQEANIRKNFIDGESYTYHKISAFFAGMFLTINSIQFIVRLVTLQDVDMGSKLAFPLIVHIIMPTLLAIWMFGISSAIPNISRVLCRSCLSADRSTLETVENVLLLVFGLYMGVTCWQGFLIPVTFTLICLLLRLTVEPHYYNQVSQSSSEFTI